MMLARFSKMMFNYKVNRFKNYFLLFIFFLLILLGDYLNSLTTETLYSYFSINNTVISLLGFSVNILFIILSMYLVMKLTVLPIDRAIKVEIKNQAKKEYSEFIASLENQKEANRVSRKIGKNQIFLELSYENFNIEIAHNDNEFIKVFWFNNTTKNFVNGRIIDFKCEKTIEDVLQNGPWFNSDRT